MKRNLDSRLIALEKQSGAQAAIDIDCGWYATMLPPYYTGPRESVVVSRVETAPHIFRTSSGANLRSARVANWR